MHDDSPEPGRCSERARCVFDGVCDKQTRGEISTGEESAIHNSLSDKYVRSHAARTISRGIIAICQFRLSGEDEREALCVRGCGGEAWGRGLGQQQRWAARTRP